MGGVGCCPSARGSALLLALWTILLLSLLVGGMAFDARVEAAVTSHARKQAAAQALARSGVEWARRTIVLGTDAAGAATNRATFARQETDALNAQARRLSRGLDIRGFRVPLGGGYFAVDIAPENARRNVNRLDDAEWCEVLDQAGAPPERWDELIDCFLDWTDDDDAHLLNGAERDDSYYLERGYAPSDAPLATLDELLLVKGFDAALVHGGPPPAEGEPPRPGLERLLSVYGDRAINVNAAGREVLLTLPWIAEGAVDAIIRGRAGVDGLAGTGDDGYDNLAQAAAAGGIALKEGDLLTISPGSHFRVRSRGVRQGVVCEIECVLWARRNDAIPVAWSEERHD